MTIYLAAPLALLALCCTGPALAATDGATHAGHAPNETAPEAKPDKERKVCRTETATGSVMPKRICRTVAQIEEDQLRAEQLRDRRNRAGGTAR